MARACACRALLLRPFSTALRGAAGPAPLPPSSHALQHQLASAAALLLSPTRSPGLAPSQALERAALGMLSVFSRSASAYDPGAGAAPTGLACLAFADAAATLRRLRVLAGLAGALECPAGERRVQEDPRFALLLQAASYNLSAGGPAGAFAGPPAQALRALADFATDLAALALPAWRAGSGAAPQASALLLQLCDAACHLLAQPSSAPDAGASALAVLRAVTHLWGACARAAPAPPAPLALLDALAAHFASASAAALPPPVEQRAEALVLLSWWNSLPSPAPAPGEEGPAQPSGRYTAQLQALSHALASSGPLPPTREQQGEERFLWHCLHLAARGAQPSGAAAGALGGSGPLEPPEAPGITLPCELHALSLLRSALANPLAPGPSALACAAAAGSFSAPSLVAATQVLAVGCSPEAFLAHAPAPTSDRTLGIFLRNRNALLAALLEELTARTLAYEEQYLQVMLGGGGRGVEPGAPHAVCAAKRLSLKRYTSMGMHKEGEGGSSSGRGRGAPAPAAATAVAREGNGAGSPGSDLLSMFTQELTLPQQRSLPALPPSSYVLSLPPQPQHDNALPPLHHLALSPPHVLLLMARALPLSTLPLPTPTLPLHPCTLAPAAARLTHALADLAVVQALTGESSARIECALASVCAEGGLSHRGLYAALGKRLLGRASNRGEDPRLAPLPLPALIALLHALCIAWEFDEDAFAAGILELQRRVESMGEEAADAGAGAASLASEQGEGVESEEEERVLWGQRAADAWRPESLGAALLRAASGVLGRGRGKGSYKHRTALAPSPDFLWGRGSSVDWAEAAAAQAAPHKEDTIWSMDGLRAPSSSPGIPWCDASGGSSSTGSSAVAMDSGTAQRLHDVLITLGSVSPFPYFVWEVPRALRLAALQASPRRTPLAHSGAEQLQLQHSVPLSPISLLAPWEGEKEGEKAAGRAQVHMHYPPPVALGALLSHCTAVLSAALPLPVKSPLHQQQVSNPSSDALRAHAQNYLSLLQGEVLQAAQAAAAEGEALPLDAQSLIHSHYISDLGIVIHCALPYHRVAFELLGPGRGGLAGAGEGVTLRTMWRTALLRVSGWTVVHLAPELLARGWALKVRSVGGGGKGLQCVPAPGALDAFSTVLTLARLAPALQKKAGAAARG